MTKRNKLALFITVISLVCFFPGIFLPMITIDLQSTIDSNIANLTIPILNKSSSILQTVVDLWDQKIYLVSFLIFAFSIVVPLTKAALLIYAILSPKLKLANQSMTIVKSIGKWSMCDVFVVAIFLTHLSTGSDPSRSMHELLIFGFEVKLDVLVNMNSQLESGFYAFLAYCLISLVSLQIYEERSL